MADTVFQPLYLRNVDLTFGDPVSGTNFKCQVRSVNLNPDTNITRIKTLCPTGQYANVDDPEWTLEVGYLFGTMSAGTTGVQQAFADYLLANSGTAVPFLFRPIAGGKGYSGTVTLLPGGIGGEQGSYSEKTVSLPVTGQPVAVAAAA
jgi:hypothetical protein